MVVGHFLGGFEPRNLFLDIFFCPFLKISEKNTKSRPTSINALLCRGRSPLACNLVTIWINLFKNPFYAVPISLQSDYNRPSERTYQTIYSNTMDEIIISIYPLEWNRPIWTPQEEEAKIWIPWEVEMVGFPRHH